MINTNNAPAVRIRPDLKAKAARAAQAEQMSLNGFLNALIEKAIREREDAELYAGFTELGNDPEGCDVEFAFAAQAEVALRD